MSWLRRLLPNSATVDVPRVVIARALRGFADGFVSVFLAVYLTALGYSPLQIGAIVTGTLLGSAALTLGVGLVAHRRELRVLLLGASLLMIATGIGFLAVTAFWALIVVSVLGTLNPSAGDVSVFLPTEQAFLAGHVEDLDRPRLYAVYNLGGAFAGAFGALASGLPESIAKWADISKIDTLRASFSLYVVVAVVIFFIYRGLRQEHAATDVVQVERKPLAQSRRTVFELAALFCIDAASGGFVVQSLLVLWLHLRFDLSTTDTAEIFFAVSLLSAFSQLLAGPLSQRIGLVRTMVFTHLPANLFLALAAFAPTAGLAIGCLLVRSLFSQMDVPARQALVMAVVTPEERAAAASVTNVPRSLASATTPLLAGALLKASTFGWPLIIAGLGKATYDLLLLARFGRRASGHQTSELGRAPSTRSPTR
ncbi:MAG: MFS transporter [Acidimicrobiia bacterium]|nr:MFS transporter [Acidimicrobiia bacterium]